MRILDADLQSCFWCLGSVTFSVSCQEIPEVCCGKWELVCCWCAESCLWFCCSCSAAWEGNVRLRSLKLRRRPASPPSNLSTMSRRPSPVRSVPTSPCSPWTTLGSRSPLSSHCGSCWHPSPKLVRFRSSLPWGFCSLESFHLNLLIIIWSVQVSTSTKRSPSGSQSPASSSASASSWVASCIRSKRSPPLCSAPTSSSSICSLLSSWTAATSCPPGRSSRTWARCCGMLWWERCGTASASDSPSSLSASLRCLEFRTSTCRSV